MKTHILEVHNLEGEKLGYYSGTGISFKIFNALRMSEQRATEERRVLCAAFPFLTFTKIVINWPANY